MGRDRYKGPKILIYDVRSLYLFHFETAFRKGLVSFTASQAFEHFIIFTIFLNSVALAIRDYNDRANETLYNTRLEQCGDVFTVIFTLECVLKIISMGFIYHKNSYMRDYWNWLDFLVVIVGVSELIPYDSVQ